MTWMKFKKTSNGNQNVKLCVCKHCRPCDRSVIKHSQTIWNFNQDPQSFQICKIFHTELRWTCVWNETAHQDIANCSQLMKRCRHKKWVDVIEYFTHSQCVRDSAIWWKSKHAKNVSHFSNSVKNIVIPVFNLFNV